MQCLVLQVLLAGWSAHANNVRHCALKFYPKDEDCQSERKPEARYGDNGRMCRKRVSGYPEKLPASR
jgi:hypothetical protein